MSAPKNPKPARPIANFFFTSEPLLRQALNLLDEKLGARSFTSEAEPFEITKYYEPEMGPGIMRLFAAWEKFVDPIELIDIKYAAWEIEKILIEENSGRRVNIDPGLISEGHLILATGKPAAHRPYLGRGVYADLTLVYHTGTFHALEWTYPDYAGAEIIALMNKLRDRFLKDRKNTEIENSGR